MRGSAALTAALTLQNCMRIGGSSRERVASPYGAPEAAPDKNTGLALLKLPPGFEYWSFGWTGDPLDDGNLTPAAHDGMGVIQQYGQDDQLCVLVRNHEVTDGPAFAAGPLQYSPGAGGGNTNFVWNTKTKQVERAWASLSGTVRNCSGGVTPWNSWISAEETLISSADGRFKHGYCFEVSANGAGRNNSMPIKDMGRFTHESVCVDPLTNTVYETEDENSAGFYRFIPNIISDDGIPNFGAGGKLQMLRIRGEDRKDMRPLAATTPSTYFDTAWVEIGDPDPDLEAGAPSCFEQGFNKGAAAFRRLEGSWFGLGKVYFTSTDGGPSGKGQVYEFDPMSETLRLIYHSSSSAACENPDNLVVTPRGALLLCEDNAGIPSNPAERLLALNLDGSVFTFAENNLDFTASGLGTYTRSESGARYRSDFRQNEWAGVCFDQTGEWLFVNIQTPGVTFAITGSWGAGPL